MGSPHRLRSSASRLRTLSLFPKSLAPLPNGGKTARSPKKPNDSPRDLHLSLRVGRSPAPPSLVVSEETTPDSGSSHEVRTPPAFQVGSVHSPVRGRRSDCIAPAEAAARPAPKCAPSGAPSFACPVCSVLVVFHDLDGLLHPRPSRDFPGFRSWGFVLQGLSRLSEDPLVSERVVPSCRSMPRRLPWGWGPLRARCTADFRVSLRGSTVAARFRFPDCEGSIPSWTFLWDLAPSASGVASANGRSFGPVTIPNCQ